MTLTPAAARLRPAGIYHVDHDLAVPVFGALPRAEHVLAVTARPGQESADLGGLLYSFRRSGALLTLLCLTRGEASPLNSGYARLEAIRPWELQLAASVLGISSATVASYRDGGLSQYPMAELTSRIQRAIREHAPDLLLVIDPVAGDPDDVAVVAATGAAARQAGVPMVACTVADARGAWMIGLGADAETARAIQRSATAAHTSQSEALPLVLARLAGPEHLRWLVAPVLSGSLCIKPPRTHSVITSGSAGDGGAPADPRAQRQAR
jgi:LmbE family N-acetylglucosaminyl deacetylase